MSNRETSSEIDDVAAAWALRCDEAALPREEQAELDSWLQGDIRRIGAFARAQAVLLHVKRAKALGTDFDGEGFESSAPAFDADAGSDIEEPAPAGLFTRRRIFAGGAAVAASGVFAVVLSTRPAAARVYETMRGETRLVPLEDAATVMLNTDSKVAVRIERAGREIELLRGEALFEVAAGGRGPLIVKAGETSLSADRAKFAVRRLEREPLQVRVCEGSVEVAHPGASGPHLLRANIQATMPGDGAIVERSIDADSIARALAWQEGMLSFEDTPLRAASAEFARYSDRRIGFANPALAAETVTGRFAANDPEGFARAVALGLGLRVHAAPDGIVLAR